MTTHNARAGLDLPVIGEKTVVSNISTHFNHLKECTPEAARGLERLAKYMAMR